MDGTPNSEQTRQIEQLKKQLAGKLISELNSAVISLSEIFSDEEEQLAKAATTAILGDTLSRVATALCETFAGGHPHVMTGLAFGFLSQVTAEVNRRLCQIHGADSGPSTESKENRSEAQAE